MTEKKINVEIPGRIQISWDGKIFNAIGDLALKESIEEIVTACGRDPAKWPTDQKALKHILKNSNWILILIRFARLALMSGSCHIPMMSFVTVEWCLQKK